MFTYKENPSVLVTYDPKFAASFVDKPLIDDTFKRKGDRTAVELGFGIFPGVGGLRVPALDIELVNVVFELSSTGVLPGVPMFGGVIAELSVNGLLIGFKGGKGFSKGGSEGIIDSGNRGLNPGVFGVLRAFDVAVELFKSGSIMGRLTLVIGFSELLLEEELFLAGNMFSPENSLGVFKVLKILLTKLSSLLLSLSGKLSVVRIPLRKLSSILFGKS